MAPENGDFGVTRRQRYLELQQKPVELRLRQLVGALVFDRILGRRNDERVGQRLGFAVHTDLTFFHRLQQCGLRFRRGSVDLVSQQQVGENRAAAESERGGAVVIDQRAGDVAGQQVRGERDALEVQL